MIAAAWVVAIVLGAAYAGLSSAVLVGSLVAMLVVGVVVGVYVQRRVGGLTGDFLGAIQQLAEVGILLALVSP